MRLKFLKTLIPTFTITALLCACNNSVTESTFDTSNHSIEVSKSEESSTVAETKEQTISVGDISLGDNELSYYIKEESNAVSVKEDESIRTTFGWGDGELTTDEVEIMEAIACELYQRELSSSGEDCVVNKGDMTEMDYQKFEYPVIYYTNDLGVLILHMRVKVVRDEVVEEKLVRFSLEQTSKGVIMSKYEEMR